MAYLWSRGPDDSLLRVGLREGSKVDIFELQEQLRKVLPEKVGAWFRGELLRLGLTAEQADQRVGDLVFAFEPGDLISETMSLGAPAPIEVVVSGRNLADSSAFMDKLRERVRRDRVAPRRPGPAVAPLPDRPGDPRPRAGRPQRRDRPRHRRIADRGHLLQPLHRRATSGATTSAATRTRSRCRSRRRR